MKKTTASEDQETRQVRKFMTDLHVAKLMGVHPASVRRWRKLNKAAGKLKYGPPYEYHGTNVVYPLDSFNRWCAQVEIVDGIPRMNLPPSSPLALSLYHAEPADTETLDA